MCYVALAVEFAIFWALTQRWKLPKYQERRETRFEHMQSFNSTGHTEALDEDENDLHYGLDVSKSAANATHTSINRRNESEDE